jgi:hypothetical protein
MKKLFIVFIALLFTGCATERFGRLQHVTQSEKNFLQCDAIQVELEKAQDFIIETNKEDNEFKGTDVLAFLGDFGIGNSMEVSSAIESASNRIIDLRALQGEKSCLTKKG